MSMIWNKQYFKRMLSFIFLIVPIALFIFEHNHMSNIAVAADEDFTLAIKTRDGLLLFDPSGTQVGFIDESHAFEVYDDSLFFLSSSVLLEYDAYGNQRNIITIPPEATYKSNFAVLPDLNFAIFDNQNDKIYFVDYEGAYLTTAMINTEPDSSSQNTDGIVVDNSLILSENGNSQLLKIDLTSYDVTILKDLSHLPGWLGAIDYSNGLYYICQDREIYSFIEGHDEEFIAALPEGNISGIVVDGNFAYLTVNFTGTVYRLNLSTGEAEEFIVGLNDPEDIEKLSIKITPTSTISSTSSTSLSSSTSTSVIRDICPSETIYGEFAEETELLRYLRDNVLSKTREGQEIIRLYFELSPAIVEMMEEDEEFKEEVKEMIDSILPLIRTD